MADLTLFLFTGSLSLSRFIYTYRLLQLSTSLCCVRLRRITHLYVRKFFTNSEPQNQYANVFYFMIVMFDSYGAVF